MSEQEKKWEEEAHKAFADRNSHKASLRRL